MSKDTCYSLPSRIDGASNLKITLGGVEYHWVGGFGAILQSYEPRGKVELGQVRVIGGVPFYVYLISKEGWKREVSWTIPNDYISAEWIRGFKRILFGVE